MMVLKIGCLALMVAAQAAEAAVVAEPLPASSNGRPSIIITVGVPSEPDKSEKDYENALSKWKASCEMIQRRCNHFLWSMAEASNQGTQLQLSIYLIGNDEGYRMMKAALDQENLNNITLVYCPTTVADIVNVTQPLIKFGLTSAYVHRIWDFGKFWAEQFLPQDVPYAMFLDLDIVFRVSIEELWVKFTQLRDTQSRWLMGARPEPGLGAAITPWHVRQEERYSNTGVVLMNLDRMRKIGFSQVLARSSLRHFCESQFWKDSSRSAWPPEQWLMNVIWGSHPWSHLSLDTPWQVNCAENEGPWPEATDRNPEKFAKKLESAYILHFCNNKIVQIAPRSSCRKLLGDTNVAGKCRDF